MDITIGVQNLPRELTLESDESAQAVADAVAAALAGKNSLELVDSRGRRIIVPTAAIGYVEIGAESRGRVGFGTV